jgi:hypothetical protein
MSKCCRRLLIAAAAVALLGSAPAQASLIMTIQNVTTSPGSTGDSFEVDLTNTGAAVTVGAFGFGLSEGSSNVVFESASTATTGDVYIFAGNSMFGPTINTTPPPIGQSLDASDIWAGAGDGFTLESGATVGLGEVFFDVAPGTPYGPTVVSFVSDETSLSDIDGDAITIDAEDSGTIDVVPEPSTLALFGVAGVAFLLTGLRKTFSR